MSVVLVPFPATTATSFSGVLCPSLGFSPLCLMAVLGFSPGPFIMSGPFSGFYIPTGGRLGIYCCCWIGAVYSHLCRSHWTDVGDCSVSVVTGRVLGVWHSCFHTVAKHWWIQDAEKNAKKIYVLCEFKDINYTICAESYDVLAQNLLILGSGSLFAT